jgi:hypothetical protein
MLPLATPARGPAAPAGAATTSDTKSASVVRKNAPDRRMCGAPIAVSRYRHPVLASPGKGTRQRWGDGTHKTCATVGEAKRNTESAARSSPRQLGDLGEIPGFASPPRDGFALSIDGPTGSVVALQSMKRGLSRLEAEVPDPYRQSSRVAAGSTGTIG